MTPKIEVNGNGTAKFWGVSIDKWLMVFQTVGVPTLFMGFVMYLAWQYVPPVVAGHVQLLEKTTQTLESMDETLKQSNVILTEVSEIQRQTKQFMTKVCEEHAEFRKKLEANGEKIESCGKKLDTIAEHTKPKT